MAIHLEILVTFPLCKLKHFFEERILGKTLGVELAGGKLKTWSILFFIKLEYDQLIIYVIQVSIILYVYTYRSYTPCGKREHFKDYDRRLRLLNIFKQAIVFLGVFKGYGWNPKHGSKRG